MGLGQEGPRGEGPVSSHQGYKLLMWFNHTDVDLDNRCRGSVLSDFSAIKLCIPYSLEGSHRAQVTGKEWGFTLHLHETGVQTSIIRNSSAYSIIHFHQYGLTDTYTLGYHPTLYPSFSCSSCPSFAHHELFQLVLVSIWQTHRRWGFRLFVFEHCFTFQRYKNFLQSYTPPAPTTGSAISPETWSFFL